MEAGTVQDRYRYRQINNNRRGSCTQPTRKYLQMADNNKTEFQELTNEIRALHAEIANIKAEQKVIRMQDVCKMAGFSMSYLYKLIHFSKIPSYKSGGGKITYFDREEVENWLLQHRRATIEEHQEKAAEYLRKEATNE